MSDNTLPDRLWIQYDSYRGEYYGQNYHSSLGKTTEYIRADVAQAQLDAERKRIVDAIDAIVGMNPNFDVHLYTQAIKAAVWNDEDEPREILKRELRGMPR